MGPASDLWATAPRLALTLLAFIPSGNPEVVLLRDRLHEGVFGEGILPGVLAQLSCDITVTVVQGAPNSSPLSCEFVYVGTGDDIFRPTPSSCQIVGQTLTKQGGAPAVPGERST